MNVTLSQHVISSSFSTRYKGESVSQMNEVQYLCMKQV